MDTIYDKLTAIADSIREKTGKAGSLTLDDMAYEISTIKGSADLNFDIVAYETEEALLASTPAENTIGVVTTTGISSWTFNTVEPTDPVSGMVWICVGTTSVVEFNALKKNSLYVYPRTVKQYVDSSWVSKTALIYQGEAWNELLESFYLYNYGEECSTLTGQWGTQVADVTITKNSNSIQFVVGGSSNRVGSTFTNKKIDLSEVTQIIFEVECTYNAMAVVCWVSDNLGTNGNVPTSVFASTTAGGTFSTKEIVLDVTKVTSGYVGVSTQAANLKLYSVRCVP